MIPDSEQCKRRKTGGGCSERTDVPPSQVHSHFTSRLLKVEPFKMAFTQSTAKPRERRERNTIEGTNKQKHHYFLCKFTPVSREKPNKPDEIGKSNIALRVWQVQAATRLLQTQQPQRSIQTSHFRRIHVLKSGAPQELMVNGKNGEKMNKNAIPSNFMVLSFPNDFLGAPPPRPRPLPVKHCQLL